jgi:hypothetical protein
VFVRLGDVVRALRALEARGGSARLALFERMWGPYAYAALGLALEWGLAERRGDVYRLSGRGRRLLRELDGCPVEARAARGGCCWRPRSANTPWSPRPAAAVSSVQAGRGMPRKAAGDA